MNVDAASLFRSSPFHRWLGCEIVRMDEREVVLTLPFREDFVGDPEHPAYHGGVLSSLIDVAGTFALIAATGRDWLTVDMRIDYHRAAKPGPLWARAEAVRAGRRIGFAEVTLTDADERTATSGRLTLVPAPERERSTTQEGRSQ